ncbi:MAG: hypothetical protein PHF37_10580 [Phycisphaerae bacterium]|nr:hypothetical protein [Phycisphaerae bacterium]
MNDPVTLALTFIILAAFIVAISKRLRRDKYVSQIKQEILGSASTSYEPLLEYYIGRKVILKLMKGDKITDFTGILKDYTADFIEIMDVDYPAGENLTQKADMVVPRKYGLVRHHGE